MNRTGFMRIEQERFAGSDITEYTVPDGVTVIEAGAFMECSGLRTVVLPESLEIIEEGAFCGCSSLGEIRILHNTKTISAIPGSVETIGEYAFAGCGLESITIPESVNMIGERALWECKYLRHVDVLGPSAVIMKDALGACPQLIDGYIAPGYPAVDTIPSELLFTLLLYSCPERHTQAHRKRALHFLHGSEELVVRRIIETGSRKSLDNLIVAGLSPDRIPGYVSYCKELGGRQDMVIKLLAVSAGNARGEEEFAL